MLKYLDLTQEQKDFICNGCGAKGSWFKIKHSMFTDFCNEHDFDYWLGYLKEHKNIADSKLHNRMMRRIGNSNLNLVQKYYYYLLAYLFYRGVVIKGNKYFNYGKRMKTKLDLEREMANYG